MWEPVKYVLAAIGGLAAFSLVAQFLTYNVLLDMPAMQAQGEFDKLRRDAMMNSRVGTSPRATLAEQSRKVAREKMDAAKSDAERAKVAAALFMGFYLTNGRGRAEVCKDSGVDLTPYRAKFEARHARLHDKALALLSAEGVSEERLYAIHRSSIVSHLQYEMQYFDGAPMNVRAACELLLKQSGTFLGRMNFESIQGRAYKAIMSAPG